MATRPASSNSTLILVVVGGLVVLGGIGAYVMFGGSSERPDPHATKPAAKPAEVDVSSLEREGMSKCQQGLAIVKKNESLLMNHALTDSQKLSLRGDLERARNLIVEGMGLLAKANEKSGNKYDVTQFTEANYTVRKKLMELRD